MANVERIEVLKGPASLLYGRIEPGGVVNIVTRQPLSVHQQRAEFTVGRYGITRGVFDVTGPLSASGNVAFRLIGAGQHAGSHRDFVSRNGGVFAPSFSWKATDRTTVTVEGEALKTSGTPDAGLPSTPVSFTLPVHVSVGEPDQDSIRNQNLRAAYYVTHRFNERWSLTQATSVLRADAYRKQVYAPDGFMLADGRDVRASGAGRGRERTEPFRSSRSRRQAGDRRATPCRAGVRGDRSRALRERPVVAETGAC
jgi:iron complex outermembrane receptor protein